MRDALVVDGIEVVDSPCSRKVCCGWFDFVQLMHLSGKSKNEGMGAVQKNLFTESCSPLAFEQFGET